MKQDWTRPRMRLGPQHFAGGLDSFLLFLRLMFVSGCCFSIPVVAYNLGPSVGLIHCLVACPLWWYHFGLPRFKEQGEGFFSAGFCLIGYLAMSASFIVILLEYFGIIKEGQPNPVVQQFAPYFRVAVGLGVAVAWVYYFLIREFIKWKARENDDWSYKGDGPSAPFSPMGEWTFDDAPGTVAVTTSDVIDGTRPVLYASHESDDDGEIVWQFHFNKNDVDRAKAMLVRLDTIIGVDPSLAALSQLPIGFVARRSGVGTDWVVERGN